MKKGKKRKERAKFEKKLKHKALFYQTKIRSINNWY